MSNFQFAGALGNKGYRNILFEGADQIEMSNPFVYYRLESLNDLKLYSSCSVRNLDWRADLTLIRRFYTRFGNNQINPDEFDHYVGNPLAILQNDEIVSFAIPLSFRDGETEIGGVATVPDRRNKGYCKELISELAFRILNKGKAVTLTTEKNNLPMRKAAEAIGMITSEETGEGTDGI